MTEVKKERRNMRRRLCLRQRDQGKDSDTKKTGIWRVAKMLTTEK